MKSCNFKKTLNSLPAQYKVSALLYLLYVKAPITQRMNEPMKHLHILIYKLHADIKTHRLQFFVITDFI